MEPGYKMDPVRIFSAVRDFFRRCAKKIIAGKVFFPARGFLLSAPAPRVGQGCKWATKQQISTARFFFFGKVFSGAAFPVNNAEPRRAHRVGEVKTGPKFCFVHNSRHRAIQDLGIEFLDRESRGEQVPSARWPLAIAKKLLSAQP